MSDSTPDYAGGNHASRTNLLLGALAISAPALVFAVACMCSMAGIGSTSWWALGLLLLLGLATVASWSLVPLDCPAVPAYLSLAIDWSQQLCRWIAPSLWLFWTTCFASYLISQIWPVVTSENLLVSYASDLICARF